MPAIDAISGTVIQRVQTEGPRKNLVMSGYHPQRRDLLPFWGFPNPYPLFTGSVFDIQPGDFEQVTPAIGARIIRVSNSGDDANIGYIEYDGTQSSLATVAPPKATIGGAFSVCRGGDIVLLECGGAWREKNSMPESGLSDTQRTVVSWYGDTTKGRPKIEWQGGTILGVSHPSNLTIDGVHFSNYKHFPKTAEFSGLKSDSASLPFYNATNFTLQDCIFDKVEVVIQGIGTARPNNVRILHCISTGHYANLSSYSQSSRPSDFYLSGIDGLTVRGCVSDRGGWNDLIKDCAGNMFNHCFYIQADCDGNTIFENNICTRASSHGVQLRSGGIARNNYFGRNAIALSFGYPPEPTPYNGEAYHNVATELHTMFKGSRPDKRYNLCTAAVYAWSVGRSQVASFNLHDNIAAHLHQEDNPLWPQRFSSLIVRSEAYGSPTTATNNHFYKIDSDTQGTTSGYTNPETVKLGNYHKEIVGSEGSFEGFMGVVLDRPLRGVSAEYSAEYGIVPWVFNKFGVAK